jgi:anion-transporting  ArsA/GET3 family ATPase
VSSIFDKRLILIAGKGGVGRSTVAASVAAACARLGRRTLLFQSNANDRYSSFFHSSAVGTDIVALRDNLYAINTNPAAALEEYGLMVLRFKRVYRMVFENRVTKYFLRAIPGLDDYSILGKAWYHTTEESRGRQVWDTVVFDMPASGHSVSMLKIPWVILDTVPDGPLTRDARALCELLRDRDRTALVLTTLAEEMPANEARELSETLRGDLGIETARLVVNQVYPDRFPSESPAAAILDALSRHVPAAGPTLSPEQARARAAGDPDLTALAAHGELARGRRRLNERYLAHLAASVPAPQAQLPLLFVPSLGPAEIDALSAELERQLA